MFQYYFQRDPAAITLQETERSEEKMLFINVDSNMTDWFETIIGIKGNADQRPSVVLLTKLIAVLQSEIIVNQFKKKIRKLIESKFSPDAATQVSSTSILEQQELGAIKKQLRISLRSRKTISSMVQFRLAQQYSIDSLQKLRQQYKLELDNSYQLSTEDISDISSEYNSSQLY